jgi:hypothetical protein
MVTFVLPTIRGQIATMGIYLAQYGGDSIINGPGRYYENLFDGGYL